MILVIFIIVLVVLLILLAFLIYCLYLNMKKHDAKKQVRWFLNEFFGLRIYFSLVYFCVNEIVTNL